MGSTPVCAMNLDNAAFCWKPVAILRALLFKNHLKFVQMGGGHLGEPDRGCIVKDGANDPQQSFSRKPPAQNG